MSTRSHIAVILKEEDRGKTFSCPDNSEYQLQTSKDKDILLIYCHYDGYIDGVGRDLLTNFPEVPETYEKLLKYIMEGDRTSFDTSYIQLRNESWDEVQPYNTNYNSIIDGDEWFNKTYIDYLYIYDTYINKWYVFNRKSSPWSLKHVIANNSNF